MKFLEMRMQATRFAVLLLSTAFCGADALEMGRRLALKRAPDFDSHRSTGSDRQSEEHSPKSIAGSLHSHDADLGQHTDSLHQEMHLMMDDDGDDEPLSRQLEWFDVKPRPQFLHAEEREPDAKGPDEEPTEPTEPPPPLPVYQDADAAAKYAESEGSEGFYPDGAKQDLDMSPDERRALKKAFDTRPDLFNSCVLVRDVAEPLRVGSSEIDQNSVGILRNSAGIRMDSSTPAPEDGAVPPPPTSEILMKGGVFDRDTGKAAEAEPQINMFAFLNSIAGEVAVIPNGEIARWTSKKKVPLAGYLCTEGGRKVFYTLPTPCLATTLDDDGMPREPPIKHFEPAPAPATPKPPSGTTAKPPSGIAPSPAEPSAPAPSPANASGVTSFLQTGSASGQNQTYARTDLDPEEVEPASSSDFVVFVGNKKLVFSSKGKAESFCTRLTEHIADDLGDHDFDLETVEPGMFKKDMKADSLLQVMRKRTTSAWTTGTKRLLVIVMDWRQGDNSRRPYSSQKQTVAHYRDVIFPRVRSAFQRMSYYQFDIEPTFVPEVIRYANYRQSYTAQGYPFPGLYIGAEQSLAVSKYAYQYRFADYDLVYVIHPQQAPTGTRGVAWVGAKGAICNGCEEISDNFQVMVAVHELGHNLGLSHASSESLEYGNPFDWMGNYPDVVGLTFGAGYKYRLGWLPPSSVAVIEAKWFSVMNNRYFLKPFDLVAPPAPGEFSAIQLQLPGAQDMYISYRSTAGAEKGVYIVLQDKGKPDSMIIDMACHTQSQKDARLRPGWVYMHPGSGFVVRVESVTDDSASLQILGVNEQQASAIRALPTFTDGMYKCPRTCTDSDLVLGQFGGCSVLAGKGYCNGGSITTGGVKKDIGKELCPVSCNNCALALAGPPEVGGHGGPVSTAAATAASTCQDRNIMIGGMTCQQAAVQHCDYNTNLGHVGNDLCRRSCGRCPAVPAPPPSTISSGTFNWPAPHYVRGIAFSVLNGTSAVWLTAEERQEEYKAALPPAPAPAPAPAPDCADDPTWSDKDGHKCAVYAQYIDSGKLSQHQACNYAGGGAMSHCKQTCGVCDPPPATTRTTTTQSTVIESGAAAASTTAPPKCEDSRCIAAWQQNTGRCYKCSDYADTYCGQDPVFMEACPKTCKLCSDSPPPPCRDDFAQESCEEWSALGFCDQPKIRKDCKKTCGQCELEAAAMVDPGWLAVLSSASEPPKEWEWGNKQALSEAKEQKARRILRRVEQKFHSGSLRFGPCSFTFAIAGATTLFYLL